MVMDAIGGTIAALRAIKDVGVGGIELKNGVEVAGKVLDVQRVAADAVGLLLEAQAEMLRMQLAEERSARRIQALEHELEDLKSKGAELAGYNLHTFNGGQLAYVHATADHGREVRFYCVSCYQKGILSLLMPTGTTADYVHKYARRSCTNKDCKAEVKEITGASSLQRPGASWPRKRI